MGNSNDQAALYRKTMWKEIQKQCEENWGKGYAELARARTAWRTWRMVNRLEKRGHHSEAEKAIAINWTARVVLKTWAELDQEAIEAEIKRVKGIVDELMFENENPNYPEVRQILEMRAYGFSEKLLHNIRNCITQVELEKLLEDESSQNK